MKNYIKIAMSVVAALLLAAAGVGSGSSSPDYAMSAQTISLLQAMATALLMFGFTPIVVSLQTGRTLMAISTVVALALAGHWAFLTDFEASHHAVMIALRIVGFSNAILAFIAHGSVPSPSTAASPDRPVAKP